jgi:TPR repeat protein
MQNAGIKPAIAGGNKKSAFLDYKEGAAGDRSETFKRFQKAANQGDAEIQFAFGKYLRKKGEGWLFDDKGKLAEADERLFPPLCLTPPLKRGLFPRFA